MMRGRPHQRGLRRRGLRRRGRVDTPGQEERLHRLIQAQAPGAAVRIVHDTALILAAADVDHGVALISGTGSVAWGRAADGRTARAGGWGYLLGDEGSGHAVGRQAVRYALGLAIITSAATALAALVSTVAERLGLTGPVVLGGGLVVHQPLLQDQLRAGLAVNGCTDIRVLKSDPAHRAVRIAGQLAAAPAA